MRARHAAPCADDVALRADLCRVPRVIGGIVVIEVIVMIGKGEEVLRAGSLVQAHQLLRLPLVRPPQVVDLHEAELRWMAVVLGVPVVIAIALHVHAPGVPVTLLRHALRRPVRPDAELRIAKPLGRLVLLQRFVGGLKRPCSNRRLLREGVCRTLREGCVCECGSGGGVADEGAASQLSRHAQHPTLTVSHTPQTSAGDLRSRAQPSCAATWTSRSGCTSSSGSGNHRSP